MIDFSKVEYYLLSEKFQTPRNRPFAAGVVHVLAGGDGNFRRGEVMKHMTMLIRDGITFLSQEQTEIGRWSERTEGIEYSGPVAEGSFFAFVDPDYGWDYDPFLVIYTKAEFVELFEDCCRNFANSNPERREEFAEAMSANGMALE